MDSIANGESSLVEVVQESQAMLLDIVEVMTKERQAIGDEIRSALQEQRFIGTCPKCGKDLRIVRSRKGSEFIGCSGYPECDVTIRSPGGPGAAVRGKVRDLWTAQGRSSAAFAVKLQASIPIVSLTRLGLRGHVRSAQGAARSLFQGRQAIHRLLWYRSASAPIRYRIRDTAVLGEKSVECALQTLKVLGRADGSSAPTWNARPARGPRPRGGRGA